MDNLPTTWEDWIANFEQWQDRVGFDKTWLGDFDLSIQFDWDRAGDTIEFGDYEGRAKWERSLQVPHQSMRDALITMITVMIIMITVMINMIIAIITMFIMVITMM